jgi:hypothetical protein
LSRRGGSGGRFWGRWRRVRLRRFSKGSDGFGVMEE